MLTSPVSTCSRMLKVRYSYCYTRLRVTPFVHMCYEEKTYCYSYTKRTPAPMYATEMGALTVTATCRNLVTRLSFSSFHPSTVGCVPASPQLV
jgi:hypothetical protein